MSGGFGWWAALLGVVYALLHFAFTVLAPVLVLAAGLLGSWNRAAGEAVPPGDRSRPRSGC